MPYLRIKCHIKVTILNVSSVRTQWPHRQLIFLILLVRTILKRNTWKDMFSQGNQKCQIKSYFDAKYYVLLKVCIARIKKYIYPSKSKTIISKAIYNQHFIFSYLVLLPWSIRQEGILTCTFLGQS